MEKQISDYTTQELKYEINRRLAMEAKAVYERRTAVTKYIRDNVEVFRGLARVMNSDELLETINLIDDLCMNCVDLNIMINDGKDFLDAINKDGKAVWVKYGPVPVDEK